MGRETSLTDTALLAELSINQIIDKALSSGARTIHIDPSSKFTIVRLRRGSRLNTINKLPNTSHEELLKQFKKLADLDTKKTSLFQSGRAKIRRNNKAYELVVDVIPVLDGEKITVEISCPANEQRLDMTGLWGTSLKQVQHLAALNQGLVLLASPQIKPSQDFLVLLLNLQASNSQVVGYFGTPLKGLNKNIEILSSIDIGKHSTIGVGMVSSTVLAKRISNMASQKQHIIAALPAKSSTAALFVWNQMVGGGSHPLTVIAEYRVNRLCQNCRVAYQPTIIERIQLSEYYKIDNQEIIKNIHKLDKAAIKDGLGNDQELSTTTKSITRLWKNSPLGCNLCNFTGFDGEIGLFEILTPSDRLSKVLGGQHSFNELRKLAESEGMISIKLDTLIKALRGIVDFNVVRQISITTD